MIAWILAAALAAHGAQRAARTEISQDITVRARAAATSIQVPPPAAAKPVIDEVLRSLSLGRGTLPPAAELIRTGADELRFLRPFPEPPFLALSPANIVALYDEWTFEVLDSKGRVAWKTEGVGRLKERVDWDGEGPDRQLAIVAGLSYRYRFTGRRAGRAFVIESDPVRLRSFARLEDYGGQTRLEAEIGLFFENGKPAFQKEADAWIDALAARLRVGEPRADGTYKVELAVREARGKLAQARANALSKRLAAALVVAPERVAVSVAPLLRGEAVSAFLPPSKGATLRSE